jgi:putative ABC transport system permease protein
MSGTFQSLRWSLRRLARARGPTLAVLLTLGLGSGATFALVSALDAVVLHPLPYPESDRLVAVGEGDQVPAQPLSAAQLAFWQGRDDSGLQALVGSKYWLVDARLAAGPEMLLALQVVGDFQAVTGVQPVLGRGLVTADQEAEAEPVVLVSHDLWQRRLGAPADVPGHRILLAGEPHTVVGVMPPGFRFPVGEDLPGQQVEVWIPLRMDAAAWTDALDHCFETVARLAPGVSLTQARARVAAVGEAGAGGATALPQRHRVSLRSLRQQVVGHLRLAFAVLLGSVFCVLLVCCANVGHLMLAKALAAERQIAIELTLGARWRDVAAEWLLEGLLLGVAGSLVGLLFAHFGIEIFRRLDPVRLPNVDGLTLGWPVLLLSLPLIAVAGGLGALVAVLRVRRLDLQSCLKEGSHQAVGAGGGRCRLARSLILFQVAASTVLAVAAGLLVLSYLQLTDTDPGFETRGVLTAWVLLPDARYADGEARARFFDQLFARLDQEAGIEVAGGVSNLPLTSSSWGSSLRVAGGAEGLGGDLQAEFRVASRGYFPALRIPLVAGRPFGAEDRGGGARVALVDESLARRLAPDGSAVGTLLSIDAAPGDPWRVVGVVGATRQADLEAPVAPTVYLPLSQYPTPFLVLAVRTLGEPTATAARLRDTVVALDADQPLFNVRTLEQLRAATTAEARVRVFLLTLLAALALTLAVVGVYGSISHSLATRSRELAVRLALGAEPGGIRRLVLGEGLRLAGLGILLGLVVSVLLMRLLSGLLFGVQPAEPLVYAGVAALLEAAAAAACYPLARRAGRVAPAATLAAP